MGTISTAIPSPEYQPLLDAICVAADICEHPRQAPQVADVGGFALVVLARWVANAQAFILLRKANLLTDAYGIARIGSELAIRTAWAWKGRAADHRFTTVEARVQALIDDGNYRTRLWFDNMMERNPSRGLVSSWTMIFSSTIGGRALMAAKNPKLPRIDQMANCSRITKDMYAFAFRGESGSVHSAAPVLGSHAAGESPIPEKLMLYNVLQATRVIFTAAAKMLEDDRAQQTVTRLEQALGGGF